MTAPQPDVPPPPVPPVAPPPGPPSSGPNWPLLIVAVVVVVVLAAAAAAFLLAGGSDSSTATGSSTDSGPAVASDTGSSSDTAADVDTSDTASTDSGGGAAVTCLSGKTADESKGNLEPFSDVTVSGKPLPTFTGDSTDDPAVGKQIPEVTGTSFDGTDLSLTCPGKPSMVMFLAHWCPHCQREVPDLTEYWKENGLPDGVDLVSVATGSSKDQPNFPPQDWLKKENWPVPVMADSEDFAAAEAFGLSGYPYFVMVDADGKVAARFSGEIDPADLAGALDKLAAGEDPLS